MEEKKILEEDLEKVSGGTGQETTQLIEMIKYAGYWDFGDSFYRMNSVDQALAMRRFLNEHGCGSYGCQFKEHYDNRYTVNKRFISHEEFMNAVGKKLGLNEIEISIFLPD